MSSDYRQTIEDHWAFLTAAPLNSVTATRVSDLPVGTQFGNVAAGVDPEGRRHLLVPIESHQAVRKGIDGPILRLVRRPLETASSYQVYADIACLDSDFDDIFATFCAVALEAVEDSAQHPIKGLYRALDKWRMLFQRSGTLLRPEQISGLFAELSVLRRMLRMNPSAHRVWSGPSRHRHDFATATVAIEVKASLKSEGRKVRVHGLDQLDPPHGGSLLLTWFRLEPASDGSNLQSLIDEILELSDDEGAVTRLLVLAGYRQTDAAHYESMRFRIVEQRWYLVDEGFPKLTNGLLGTAGVPVSVQEVEYTIDLSGEHPVPMESDDVTHDLQRMLKEPV